MAVLVTGASGFLGGALLRQLRAKGEAALGVGRDPVQSAAIGALAFDLADPAAIEPLTQAALRAGVRQIVHCAALTAPWGPAGAFQRSNVEATRTVLALARRLGGVRTVVISTPTVYFRFADQIALTEAEPLPPPVNAYAATKAQAEALALASGAVVLRPRGIYGAGDRALLPRLARAMREGPLPLLRGGDAATDLTHVDDVIAAIRAALASDAAGVFNISGGAPLVLREVVDAVGVKLGITPRWRAVPLTVAMAAARAMEWHGALTGREPRVTRYGLGLFAYTQTLDISAARRAFGWQPQIGFAEGLRRSFEGEV